MPRVTTILIVLALCIATVVCTPTCGPNAIFSNCASACPITCKNYLNPPKLCIQVCVKRCTCLNGRILNNKGECVLPNECY
ncbi:venom peptide SjAPI-2 [Vespula maculifrons]|uniref:Venom peptide SjAPI-2 n=1 Tax=Vespula maculifrons TaxID=7453 RepID=A0ABD2CMH1_VESMC